MFYWREQLLIVNKTIQPRILIKHWPTDILSIKRVQSYLSSFEFFTVYAVTYTRVWSTDIIHLQRISSKSLANIRILPDRRVTEKLLLSSSSSSNGKIKQMYMRVRPLRTCFERISGRRPSDFRCLRAASNNNYYGYYPQKPKILSATVRGDWDPTGELVTIYHNIRDRVKVTVTKRGVE